MIRDDRMTTGTAGRSSGEIQKEIRRTRSDLDSTVVAIEERLTLGQLVDEAWHFLRRKKEESGGQPGTTSRLVRDHPVPMALVGAGLGLLAVEAVGGGGEPSPRRIQTGGHGSEADTGDSGMKERAAHAKDRVSEMAGSAGDTLSEVGDRARGHAHDARERVQEAGGKVAHEVQHGARRARRGIAHQMDENPLAIGAAAFALGVAAGSLLPSSRWEDETMGEARDTLVREAKETGRETLDEVKEVAAAATEAAKDEAERQGLTPEEMGDRASGERPGRTPPPPPH
jgi:ElaB/YqjD/DUF883 family membrane-anchored ribosome-binding protein